MEEKKSPKKEYNVRLINSRKVREIASGFKVTTDYLEKLEELVEKKIKESYLRASGNRRTTLLRRDL